MSKTGASEAKAELQLARYKFILMKIDFLQELLASPDMSFSVRSAVENDVESNNLEGSGLSKGCFLFFFEVLKGT